uniref:Uncharacterized protein n=1 Tax=Tanacetum cinerariifolium TaxID=118510 RepID=A0A6L2NLN1_TANCI|nr:hypothetical protein [Tanacetum cinerariifolium]
MEMESQSHVASVKACYTMDFVHFALRELEIHSLLIQLRILTMILQNLSTHHHNPRHTLVSYVETIITTQAFREEQHQPENIQELLRKLLNDLQVLNGIIPERGEHAAQISTSYWKCPVFYDDDDDDDDEYSIQYREYLENSSNAITPNL